MIESVHCPHCATHYALRPSRVHRQHRRALCFHCDQVFSIQNEVQRLFPEEDLDLLGAPDEATITSAFPSFLSDEEEARSTGPLPTLKELSEVRTPEAIPEFEFAPQEPTAPEPEPQYSLTLGDLEQPDSSMERTIILNPAGHPELRGVSAPPPLSPEELEALGMGAKEPKAATPAEGMLEQETGTATYSSARDAIDKLLSGTPSPQRIRPMSMSRPSAPMDLESTLDALEETLGGARVPPPPPPPTYPEEEPGSTVMLSHHELDQAMSSQTAEPEPSASTQLLHLSDLEEELQALPQAPMEATLRMTRPILEPPPINPLPPPPPPPVQAEAVQDPNLLKVQLEQETLSNVGMDQLIQMVEQGRVKEYHLVARQFSENWLEAGKVPALRPVFERLRRAAAVQMGPAPTLTNETAPVKKSLFGGLFGGKN